MSRSRAKSGFSRTGWKGARKMPVFRNLLGSLMGLGLRSSGARPIVRAARGRSNPTFIAAGMRRWLVHPAHPVAAVCAKGHADAAEAVVGFASGLGGRLGFLQCSTIGAAP